MIDKFEIGAYHPVFSSGHRELPCCSSRHRCPRRGGGACSTRRGRRQACSRRRCRRPGWVTGSAPARQGAGRTPCQRSPAAAPRGEQAEPQGARKRRVGTSGRAPSRRRLPGGRRSARAEPSACAWAWGSPEHRGRARRPWCQEHLGR